MNKIKQILRIDKRTKLDGTIYYLTDALLEDGLECVGFGRDFKIGDKVQSFHDDKWNMVKMIKAKEA